MKKSFTWQVFSAMLILLPLLTQGCIQQTGALVSEPEDASLAPEDAGLVPENFTFSMGGVKIAIPLPAGYVETSRQAVAEEFRPPENIFGVYAAALAQGEAVTLTRGRRLFVISARPEFMRESVSWEFYRAMQRDLERVNGSFSSERLAHLKALDANYDARDEFLAHSLGVYDRGRGSLSLVRIGRPAAGAPGVRSVVIQNVVLMRGRCFNIFFFGPLESESDIYAAMRENKTYMSILESGREGWDMVSPAQDDMAGESGMALYAERE